MSRGVAQKMHRQRCTANVGFLIGLWGQQAARFLQSEITNACTVSPACITDPHTCSWSVWYFHRVELQARFHLLLSLEKSIHVVPILTLL